jgi:hypothetical protein
MMPEYTGSYMDGVIAERALRLDPEESLEGNTLVSLESQSELAEEDILTYIQENFAGFIRILRSLKKEDQELLLSYYLLSKTQNTLATIHKSTQTVCSFRIRMAVKTLGTFIMMGGAPTVEKMHEVLTQAGLEDSLVKIDLSKVIDLYVKTRNFQKIAELHHLHRPDIRRAMSRASKQLMESTDPRENAVGVYIHSLIGERKAATIKRQHIFLKEADVCGQFRVSVEDEDFEQLWVSRANR